MHEEGVLDDERRGAPAQLSGLGDPESHESRAVVVLGRHARSLEAISSVLVQTGARIVGKTTQPASALALVEEHRPDLIIAELGARSREMDTLACLRAACTLVPELKAIVLAPHADARDIEAAFAAGAFAYILTQQEQSPHNASPGV